MILWFCLKNVSIGHTYLYHVKENFVIPHHSLHYLGICNCPLVRYIYTTHIGRGRIKSLFTHCPFTFTDHCTTVESVSLGGRAARKRTGFLSRHVTQVTYPSACARIPLFSSPLRTFPLTHKSLLATLPYWTTLYHMQGFFCPPAPQRGQLKWKPLCR